MEVYVEMRLKEKLSPEEEELVDKLLVAGKKRRQIRRILKVYGSTSK